MIIVRKGNKRQGDFHFGDFRGENPSSLAVFSRCVHSTSLPLSRAFFKAATPHTRMIFTAKIIHSLQEAYIQLHR